MQTFKDKVAVVTGAASGIGRGIAERCMVEGMKVVLADIEQEALEAARREMTAKGGDVLAVRTDVSKHEDVEALARETIRSFGAVHFLCNNAGVSLYGYMWENSLADWEWMMGVNLWGVIHGIRTFVPIMLRQDTEGHILNTASMVGLASPLPYGGIYSMTKHAVVALSESLHKDLASRNAKVKVSVLCPADVDTRIMDSARNRPEELKARASEHTRHVEVELLAQGLRDNLEKGLSPAQVAEHVFRAVRDEKFYILPHDHRHLIRERLDNMMEGRNP